MKGHLLWLHYLIDTGRNELHPRRTTACELKLKHNWIMQQNSVSRMTQKEDMSWSFLMSVPLLSTQFLRNNLKELCYICYNDHWDSWIKWYMNMSLNRHINCNKTVHECTVTNHTLKNKILTWTTKPWSHKNLSFSHSYLSLLVLRFQQMWKYY